MIESILHFLGFCGDAHSHISLSDLILSNYNNADAINSFRDFYGRLIKRFKK